MSFRFFFVGGGAVSYGYDLEYGSIHLFGSINYGIGYSFNKVLIYDTDLLSGDDWIDGGDIEVGVDYFFTNSQGLELSFKTSIDREPSISYLGVLNYLYRFENKILYIGMDMGVNQSHKTSFSYVYDDVNTCPYKYTSCYTSAFMFPKGYNFESNLNIGTRIFTNDYFFVGAGVRFGLLPIKTPYETSIASDALLSTVHYDDVFSVSRYKMSVFISSGFMW